MAFVLFYLIGAFVAGMACIIFLDEVRENFKTAGMEPAFGFYLFLLASALSWYGFALIIKDIRTYNKNLREKEKRATPEN